MEHAGKGDLKSVIRKHIQNDHKPLLEEQIWKWFAEIAAAVKYLHSRKIIHRDIKVENIFLSQDNSVKLGDFGISKVLEHSMDLANSGVGTPYYLSPEICQGLKYNFKTDIWMMGCLLYELCTLNKPFKSESIKILIKSIIDKQPELNGINYSEGLVNLITLMLKKLPEERPNIEEVWIRIHMFSNVGNIKVNSSVSKTSSYKSIDKNKLKIEVEEEEEEILANKSEINITPNSNVNNLLLNKSVNMNLNSLKSLQSKTPSEDKSTPVSLMNLEYKNKLDFNTKLQELTSSSKKYTPSHCKRDVDKIRKNMQISPMNNLPEACTINDKRRQSSTTANSTPKNIGSDVNINITSTNTVNNSNYKDRDYSNTPIIRKNILGSYSLVNIGSNSSNKKYTNSPNTPNTPNTPNNVSNSIINNTVNSNNTANKGSNTPNSNTLYNNFNNSSTNKSNNSNNITNINPSTTSNTPNNTTSKEKASLIINSNASKNFRNRHFRHISINISSIQSPEHKAIYQIENIEKVEKLEFPSPINNPLKPHQLQQQQNTKSNNVKSILTPTNLTNPCNKISPKEALIQKECPNTTKVGSSGKKTKDPEDSFLRRSLIRNFLLERYGKENFEIMYNNIIERDYIDEKLIIELVGEDYKVAINYLKYLTGRK
jgi:serine/threonine protein kinase